MTRDQLEADRELLLSLLVGFSVGRGASSVYAAKLIIDEWYSQLVEVVPSEVTSDFQLELEV